MKRTLLVVGLWAVLVTVAPGPAVAAGWATRGEVRRAAEVQRQIALLRREEAALRKALVAVPPPLRAASTAERRVLLPTEAAWLQARLDSALLRLKALASELAALPPDARTPQVAAASTPADPQGLTPLDVTGGSGQVGDPRAFNPALSVIPDVAFFRDSRRGASPLVVGQADGFDDAHGGPIGPVLEEGFNLREAELAFNASVDPYFDAFALMVVGAGGIAVEEVYAQTRRLPAGLQLRGGRFLSWFGYLNRQHPHQWDFVDQNLAMQMLLGPAGIAETGVRVSWLPSLPVFVQIGGELLQGRNQGLAFHAGDESYPGLTVGAPDRVLSYHPGPRLFTTFAKISPDLGYSHTLQVGVSFAGSLAHQEIHDHDADVVPEDVLDGHATVWGIDVVHRYDSPREYGAGDFKLQAEYLHRRRHFDVLGTPLTDDVSNSGVYLQAIYGVAPRWQVAGRTSAAGLVNDRERGATRSSWDAGVMHSAAVTFNPTEFSRIRVQYNRGRIPVARSPERFHQLFVQLQVSLGAHGAHTY